MKSEKLLISPNCCPTCEKEMVTAVDDQWQSKWCKFGHGWHICTEHDVVVPKPIPNNLYLERGGDVKVCTCGKDDGFETTDDDPEEKITMDAKQVLSRLSVSHDPSMWAFFEEVRIGTGFTKDSEQRLDAWAICYLPSKRNVTRAFEIKVSRSDYFSEIKKPRKRRAGLRLSNEFYFVVPKGLVSATEVPPECGLIEVGKTGALNVKIAAPYRECSPSWLFLASLCRRMDKERAGLIKSMTDYDFELENGYVAMENILSNHIIKWGEFDQGSREIPNQIVDALRKVYYEYRDRIKSMYKVKGKKL